MCWMSVKGWISLRVKRLSVLIWYSGDYRGITGEFIPYKELNYRTLEEFLRTLPDVVSLERYDKIKLHRIAVLVGKYIEITRLHSSRILTARLLTLCQQDLDGGCLPEEGVCQGVSAQGGVCPGRVCLPGGQVSATPPVDRHTPVKT